MADPDCLFCKIVAGEIPSHKIDEDDKTLAFMDINPWTRGHALVIPKAHSRNLYDIEPADLAAMHATAQRVAQRIRDRLASEGVNILQSSESVAMQTVFHSHVHVIPRYSDDGLRLPAHPQPADHEELAQLAEELSGG
ncbi:MAG: histidine triad family protein [Solirubrobacteraceae bacterium]|nr:histidine triad family protein [Solirubrobacteraceae bacterium]